MCTTGAIVLKGIQSKRVYGFKTSDSPWCGYWHGLVNRSDEGYDSLSYGLIPQQGINAGMNEKGLTLISSYFDYVESVPVVNAIQHNSYEIEESPWRGDLRGIVQAEVLAKHTTSKQALDYFQSEFQYKQAAVGGNHIIVDPSGELYVYEHCRGMTGVEHAASTGYVVRSNQSMTLYQEEQELMSAITKEDREIRLMEATSVLEAIKQREDELEDLEVIQMLQSMTSLHRGIGEAPGSICAHGVTKGRSNSSDPHYTLSAIIWDVTNKVMYYTIGNPCESEWKTMQL